jgi:hypothetical protein
MHVHVPVQNELDMQLQGVRWLPSPEWSMPSPGPPGTSPHTAALEWPFSTLFPPTPERLAEALTHSPPADEPPSLMIPQPPPADTILQPVQLLEELHQSVSTLRSVEAVPQPPPPPLPPASPQDWHAPVDRPESLSNLPLLGASALPPRDEVKYADHQLGDAHAAQRCVHGSPGPSALPAPPADGSPASVVRWDSAVDDSAATPLWTPRAVAAEGPNMAAARPANHAGRSDEGPRWEATDQQYGIGDHAQQLAHGTAHTLPGDHGMSQQRHASQDAYQGTRGGSREGSAKERQDQGQEKGQSWDDHEREEQGDRETGQSREGPLEGAREPKHHQHRHHHRSDMGRQDQQQKVPGSDKVGQHHDRQDRSCHEGPERRGGRDQHDAERRDDRHGASSSRWRDERRDRNRDRDRPDDRRAHAHRHEHRPSDGRHGGDALLLSSRSRSAEARKSHWESRFDEGRIFCCR